MSARVHSRSGERGMVLLILLFLAAVMLIGASAAALRLVTEGRRQKEDELVWRGEQYVRAIRLYYRRFGQFPHTFDDFSKNPGNLHFLRKEYKDPMNSTDGSWRYIYVSPTGQLQGSLTRLLPIGMVPLGGQQPVPGASAGSPGANPFGNILSGMGGSGSGGAPAGPGGTAGTGTNAPAQSGGPSGTQSSQSNPSDLSAIADTSGGAGLPADFGTILGSGMGGVQPPKKAIENAQTLDSPVLGGLLVGIGSKVDRKSVRFYNGYGKYREWEFIWDPAQEAAAASGLPTGGGVLPTGIGLGPTGAPATGTPPPGNPPLTGTPPPQPQ